MSSTSSKQSSWESRTSWPTGGRIFHDPSLNDYGIFDDMNEGLGLDACMDKSQMAMSSIGAEFFNCVLASTILREYGSMKQNHAQSKLAVAVNTFPYIDCNQTIAIKDRNRHGTQADGPLSSDGRLGLFTKIGSLLVIGSQGIESYLSARIKQFLPNKPSLETSTDVSPPPTPPDSCSRASSPAYPDDGIYPHVVRAGHNGSKAQEKSGMGIYMTRLKEHCDKKGWHFTYRYQQMGYHESWWKVKVLVQGQEIEAEAKSKKDARFQACKKACKRLAINI